MKKTIRTFAEVEEISRRLRKELKMARTYLAPAYIAVTCKTADQLSERFGLSVNADEIRFGQLIERASGQWKSTPTRKKDDPRDGRGRRILPKSVVVHLTEAKRRGHQVTSLEEEDGEK
jgi:hypothetical protein